MIKNTLVILFVMFALPAIALAATSDFTIKALVGGDTTSPTTPVMLSVLPVAATQIDVTWSASTDDFLLSGYVLYRDGLPHATTTLTTFSDTGLTPETLYAYDVYAFDSSFNISTTSNSLATTTLAIPVTPPPVATTTESSGSQSSTRRVILQDLTIDNTTDSVVINWQTNRASRFIIRWGRFDDYNGGYVANNVYKELHETTINNLEPGTVYLYELVGITPVGVSRVLKRGQFTTNETINIVPPPNVQRLQALVEGSDVRLSWQLPSTDSISSVRVVRSHLGYPSGLYDGAVVYEGLGTSVLNEDVLKINPSQYYSVFVVDKDGNVSSGAVVRVKKADFVEEVFIKENSNTSTETLAPKEDEEILVFGFDINNISVSQTGEIFTFIDEYISLTKDNSFVISIPYSSLPKHLKSIVVTLIDPTDHKRSYSFLLRINKDRTAYEAIIAPLNVIGISRLQIEIFDFERQVVGLYRKQIDFKASEDVSKEVIFPDKIVSSVSDVLKVVMSSAGLFILLILLLLYLLWKRKTEDNL